MSSADLDVYFDGRLDNLRPVSSLVERVCRRLALDETTSYHVELAVVEAVTNCMRHAFADQEQRPMHVAAQVDDDTLVISVTDSAKPAALDLDLGAGGCEVPDALQEGGRGLFLIRSLMDHVEHRATAAGNTLRMTKALR